MEETMKRYTLLCCLVAFAAAVVVFAAGCKLFSKEEPAPEPEKTPVVEPTKVEETPPPEATKEEVKPEEPETLVSKEDIEKAAKIYNMLHDENLKDKAKEQGFAKFLEDFDWDLEKYEAIIYDIGRDPASTKIYKELQENPPEEAK
jgi:hypothetical protein